MKKIYFMMTAALFAASVSAQKLDLKFQPTRQIASLPAQCNNEAYAKSHQANVRRSGIGLPISNPALYLPFRLAGAAASADTIITAQPEGELLKNCYQQATGYYVFWGYVLTSVTDGSAVDVVKGADGSVYVKNLLSTLPTNYWVKGYQAEGDTIAFDFPQKIYSETGTDGSVYDYSLWRMNYTQVEEDGETYYTYVPDSVSQTMKFTLRNDTLQLVEDPYLLIGLGTSDAGEWTGYGDYSCKIFKLNESVSAPSDAASIEQALICDNSGEPDYHIGKMAIEGDNVYIGGLVSGNDTGWAKGKINGNKVTFTGTQYMGVNETALSHEYFSPAGKVEMYNAEWDYTYDSVYVEKEIVFDYDAAAKKLTSDGGFIVNKGTNDINQEAEFFSPVIEPYIEIPGKPIGATFEDFYDYDEDYGLGYAQFSIYRQSTDGNFLNPAKLYYNVYFDDELFTFTPDEYPEFTEDVTDMPYSYNGDYVSAYGDSHLFYYFTTGFDKLGVGTVYKDGDDRYEGEIEWYYITTDGIKKIDGDNMASTRSVTYTDITGRRLASPARGVNIRTTTLSDGTVHTQKVIVR